jgi:chromosome segregation ATPase
MSDNLTKSGTDPRSFEERIFARFDALDARFDALDARFDALDARFDAMDARFDAMDARLNKMEENIGARFAAQDLRLAKLEETVDVRLRETRPIWEGVQLELRRLNAKFEQYVEDLFEIRSDQRILRKRVDVLEGIAP